MIDTAITLPDLEEFFRHPCWRWLKGFTNEMAQLQVASILGSDPQHAAWSIARSQGYYEAMSAISGNMQTQLGPISFEQYCLEKLTDQLTANSEPIEA